jgi:hypothetical protein
VFRRWCPLYVTFLCPDWLLSLQILSRRPSSEYIGHWNYSISDRILTPVTGTVLSAWGRKQVRKTFAFTCPPSLSHFARLVPVAWECNHYLPPNSKQGPCFRSEWVPMQRIGSYSKKFGSFGFRRKGQGSEMIGTNNI